MSTVPVSVVGEGVLASLHRDVLGRHPACQLLPSGELPERNGVADLCGPPADCADLLGVLVRRRVPIALSLPTQWSDGELSRLVQAGRKRRVPMVALGSLRTLPAAARLKEIVSSGVLGRLRSLRLLRRGVDARPGDGGADGRLAAWRDADLCGWLVAGESCDAQVVAEAGAEGGAEREVVLAGELGSVEARFAFGRSPEMTVTTGEWRRTRRVPSLGQGEAHLAELQLLVAARQYERPWLLLPSLQEVVSAAGIASAAR